MAFDTSQPSYTEFRETLKTKSSPVVIWCGAGLSAPVLPLWNELRGKIIEYAIQQNASLPIDHVALSNAKIELARQETDLWKAFSNLKEAMGPLSFRSAIEGKIKPALGLKSPEIYENLWALGINGFISLNYDKFCSKSYHVKNPGTQLREVQGVDLNRHSDILRTGAKFVLNLHGVIDDFENCIITTSDYDRLKNIAGYSHVVTGAISARTMVFLGLSVTDPAVAGHLEKLTSGGVHLNGHYWITQNSDVKTREWTEAHGIRGIYYDTHSDINQLISDCKTYIPKETHSEPISPTIVGALETIPVPSEIVKLEANEIRVLLNGKAKSILSDNSESAKKLYVEFLTEYAEPIYRAWSAGVSPGRNKYFDYTLKTALAKGAFGQVYKAIDNRGSTVAIKVLHGYSSVEDEVLSSFRRGVKSMKILSRNNVNGMVPYIAAWEIPASVAMEFIDGNNLEEAWQIGLLKTWDEKIKAACELVEIISIAHALPERVLHRDIRPANVMLKSGVEEDDWQVAVLDFDLSWHKDAVEGSINLSKSMNGYLSPEQTDQRLRRLSRSALVDSFGLGMTFYFLLSGKHPHVNQQEYAGWNGELLKLAKRHPHEGWQSLPFRFARLIYNATLSQQDLRLEVVSIKGEAQSLAQCLLGGESLYSAELFAEEITCRIAITRCGGVYDWNPKVMEGSVAIRDGLSFHCRGDENEKICHLTIEWLQVGPTGFENVRKYVIQRRDDAVAKLKRAFIGITESSYSMSHCRVSGTARVNEMRQAGRLDAICAAASGAISDLSLK